MQQRKIAFAVCPTGQTRDNHGTDADNIPLGYRWVIGAGLGAFMAHSPPVQRHQME